MGGAVLVGAWPEVEGLGWVWQVCVAVVRAGLEAEGLGFAERGGGGGPGAGLESGGLVISTSLLW